MVVALGKSHFGQQEQQQKKERNRTNSQRTCDKHSNVQNTSEAVRFLPHLHTCRTCAFVPMCVCVYVTNILANVWPLLFLVIFSTWCLSVYTRHNTQIASFDCAHCIEFIRYAFGLMDFKLGHTGTDKIISQRPNACRPRCDLQRYNLTQCAMRAVPTIASDFYVRIIAMYIFRIFSWLSLSLCSFGLFLCCVSLGRRFLHTLVLILVHQLH